jgi:hypothetical protein
LGLLVKLNQIFISICASQRKIPLPHKSAQVHYFGSFPFDISILLTAGRREDYTGKAILEYFNKE